MRIIVDADATPSINLIEKLASNDQVPCILIADDTHDLTSTYSEVITVSKGFQSVDMYLVNIIKEHDIVITQDYGLATIALSKNCYVIHPKGTIYTNDNIDIMLAKISGIFKRRYALDEITDGNIRINKASRAVYKNEKELEMTAKEFELLLLLMENKGRALSKEYIFEQVWGSDSFSEQQTLTVHIKWLRQKIEDAPKNPKKIVTVWGVGYKYESV